MRLIDEHRRRVALLTSDNYNVFIGNAGGVLSTPELLAARLPGISAENITAFQIDEFNNISCYIDSDFGIQMRNTGIGNIVRHFIDLDGKVNAMNQQQFQGQSVTAIHFPKLATLSSSVFDSHQSRMLNLPNLTTAGAHCFYRMTPLWYARFPLCHTLGNAAFRVISGCNKKRIYLPNVTTYGDGLGYNEVFRDCNQNGIKIYVHPSMLTINSGGLEGDLNYAQNRNAIIIPVTDFTPPAAVTDLSVSDITDTTATLNFTSPASLNALDFYMVWIESDIYKKYTQGYFNEKYNPYMEITGPGHAISGLVPETNYKVKIVACDEFWNEADYSNEISFKTL